jgi:uncharacterized protein
MITTQRALQILRDEGCSENVIAHCLTVSEHATEIAEKLVASGKKVDVELVTIGGLLHDLGRCKSHGIDHAVVGADIAAELGLDPSIIDIIKKHIGAGITREEAKELGLPEDDYIPSTLEEKIVAHADNFTSGDKRMTMAQLMEKIKKRNFSNESKARIIALAEEIGIY